MPNKDKAPLIHLFVTLETLNGAEWMMIRLVQQITDRRTLIITYRNSAAQKALAELALPHVEIIELAPVKTRLRPFTAMFKLAGILRRNQGATIISWMYNAGLLALAAKWISMKPAHIIWNMRSTPTDPSALSRSANLAIRLCRYFRRAPSAIIQTSQRNKAAHEAVGITAASTYVIGNGYNLPQTRPTTDRASDQDTAPNGSPSTGPTIGIVGRFHPVKDHETFFHTARLIKDQHPGVKIHACGADITATNDAITDMLARHNLTYDDVTLFGPVSDMTEFYQSLDYLFVTSRIEGFPNVIAEAMTQGVICISTDVGAAAEMIDGNGKIAPVGDAAALAAAFDALAKQENQSLSAMRQAAQDSIYRRFDMPQIAAQYRDAIAYAEKSTD